MVEAVVYVGAVLDALPYILTVIVLAGFIGKKNATRPAPRAALRQGTLKLRLKLSFSNIPGCGV